MIRSLLLIITVITLFEGCAIVKPWERAMLADPIMQLDYLAEEKGVVEHMLGTREGSSGGYGVGGGGCGCN